MELGMMIKLARTRKGITQKRLARKVGITNTRLCELESCRYRIPDDLLVMIVRELNRPEILQSRCNQCPVSQSNKAA